MRRALTRVSMLGAIVALAAMLPVDGAGARDAASVRVAADHLNNPRGVSVGLDGRTVYVTEAGNGGLTDQSRCDNVVSPESGQKTLTCLSHTGAVTAVRGTTVWRVRQNLPSLGDTSGVGTTGPSDTIDIGHGQLITTMQGATMPHHPQKWDPEYTKVFAHVLDNGDPVLNLGEFEAKHDPDRQGNDSDPYGVAADRDPGRGGVVVDAAGNDLLEVGEQGIHVRAVFPNRMVPNPFGPGTMPQQAVPTSVALGPDGAWYVGELGGFPFTPGTSRIWRIAPGHAPQVWKDGFTAITGLAFGPDGSLYVSEMAKHGIGPVLGGDPSADPSGGLFRVDRNGNVSEIVVPGLVLAGGVAVSPDNTIYQSSCSIGNATGGPCTGQLLAIGI